MGVIQVPSDALWGAQTQRSLQFFAIGQQRMPIEVIHALAHIKHAAAEVNQALGLLEPAVADAIAGAASRVAQGEFDVHFPLSVWQTGSGTQTHMNVNEVIANLASVALGGELGTQRLVHAHDQVNLGQSSNDVFPTAIHLAVLGQTWSLQASMTHLRQALQAKATTLAGVPKVGRTHLQDATAITFGQEFGAYDAQLAHAEQGLHNALPAVHALAIGGTAVGTGQNTHPAFGERVAARLSERLSVPQGKTLKVAHNRFAALSGQEPLVLLHAALRSLAIALMKIGNDVRLMASGPHGGLGEIRLPANEPGSSIMPGKVNPTQVEALTMVCVQVMGHDVSIGMAASQGQFELNVYQPLIVHNTLDSLRLLTDAMDSFRQHCVEGIEVNAAHAAQVLSRSLMMATALTPHIGYERAARIVAHAQSSGLTLRDAALAVGGISADEFDAWVVHGPG